MVTMYGQSIELRPRKPKNRLLQFRLRPQQKLSGLSGDNVSFRENFIKYLQNSTLHGLKYVGDGEISWFERIFFTLSFCLVFCLSAYFISHVWMKWSASPVIITLNSLATPIAEFPFPAITICNMNQARKSAVANIRPWTTEYSFLKYLCLNQTAMNTTGSKSEKWPRFRKFMLDVSQSCDDMLVMCRYGSESYNCYELFNTILTDEGLCCIFNGVHPRFLKKEYDHTMEFNMTDSAANDWTPEHGFPSSDYESNKYSYPRPAAGTGSAMGLYIVLDANIGEYYCSSTGSYGFKVLLHNPIESPKIAHYGISLAAGFETQIVVTPVISQASNRIRRVPADVRQCLFENENYLSYFKTYTRRNCEMECESRIYDRNCGCVLYYLPLIRSDINICGGPNQMCVQSVRQLIESKTNDSFMCNCLPSCYAISYESELSAAPTLKQAALSHVDYLSNVLRAHDIDDLAILHVFFKENSFRSQIKEELIGFTEFLSNTGGLLGLFMGFSVVSIVELIYFMTFRPYCTQQRIDDGEQFYPNEIFTATPILTKPRKRTFGDRIRRLTCRIHRKFKAVFSLNETNRREFYPYID